MALLGMGECDYPQEQRTFQDRLLQLRILLFGLLQDGDVGVGVFPEREEILAGGERPLCADRISVRGTSDWRYDCQRS
jgi:hypothetical protein